jgi:hypothetical protein
MNLGTGNFSERGFPSNHHKYFAWANVARGASNLYVSHCDTGSMSKEGRCAIESGLIKEYGTMCNDRQPLRFF